MDDWFDSIILSLAGKVVAYSRGPRELLRATP
jgi:hypothetical protein